MIKLRLMKFNFKIFLLAILSCCFLNTAFELSDNEKETNFENETHCYVHQNDRGHFTFSTKTIPYIDLTLNLQHPSGLSENWIDQYSSSFSLRYCPPPPNRLFLRHASLLI